MKTSARRALLIVCAAAVFASSAQAQTYPVKSVRFIVPAPPGSTPDFLARLIGQKLTEMWGQSVLVETVLGASGNIATDRVAKSAPDGYTLLFNTIGPIAINQNLFGKLPYDPVKDFAPITMVAITSTATVTETAPECAMTNTSPTAGRSPVGRSKARART